MEFNKIVYNVSFHCLCFISININRLLLYPILLIIIVTSMKSISKNYELHIMIILTITSA